MSFSITDSVSWVGKVDWELRKFHGEEYTTQRGTSYNAYLVRDEKNVLIDTVWEPYGEEFLANLEKNIDLQKIDYVVANHGEIDHSGALSALMSRIPDKPIYCTANGIKSLKGQYHRDWNFQPVKTGDKLNLGSRELVFIEAPMLHWPDSMFCYLTGDKILFSNDAFGQHLASELHYNDLVDQAELYQEAIKYYANILTPFSMLVDKKIKELMALNLPVEMICPSHGVIWRKEPLQIVEQYLKWANAWQENQTTILYDTMWNGTRRMAESLAEGIRTADPSMTIKLYNVARSDKTEIIAEVFKSKAIFVGSPTINRGILSSVAAILEEIRGLSFKNKKAMAFGAYGWSGESVKQISQKLVDAGFAVLNDGLRLTWYPDSQGIEECMQSGKAFAEQLK
jgi:flavorubredoxin